MKNIPVLLAALFLLSPVAAAQDISGVWHGKAEVGAQTMRINFDIRPTDEGWSGAMQSPDQSGDWIPFTHVEVRTDTLKAVIASLLFSYQGVFSGETIIGSFTQSGMTIPLDFSREEVALRRPQEPKPKYPYGIEEVKFRNEAAGITLAGTLTLPWVGEKPYPAVVLVSGSGPQDRDETVAGHRPFWIIADYLTQNGIAVLRYDDRGVGESEGNYAAATLGDFAGDASAALAYLRSRPEIAAGEVGLIGHSEGGMIGLMLAAEKQTGFIVTLAGPGVDGKSLLDMQRSALMRTSGASDAYIDAYNRKMNEASDLAIALDDKQELRDSLTKLFAGTPFESSIEAAVAQFSSPELRSLLAFDPAAYYPRITCPVLALNGEKDLQVPAGPNLEAIHRGLTHNPNLSIRSYPALNHLFQSAVTGLPTEYAHIEETFNREALRDIVEWIKKITSR